MTSMKKLLAFFGFKAQKKWTTQDYLDDVREINKGLYDTLLAYYDVINRLEEENKGLKAKTKEQDEKLCDIRDRLVSGYKSNPWAYIRLLCKKHFSLDVTT